MPRALSHVWRHFSPANVNGKAVYICKYCAKTYVKNATKMQKHIVKCPKFPQGSNQETPDMMPTSSASIRSGNYSAASDTLLTVPGRSGIKMFFLTQWMYLAREM